MAVSDGVGAVAVEGVQADAEYMLSRALGCQRESGETKGQYL